MLLEVNNSNISILHEFWEIGECKDAMYISLLLSPLFSHLVN